MTGRHNLDSISDDLDTISEEKIKVFSFFTSARIQTNGEAPDKLDVFIPNRPNAGYSLHSWPCASILAWFLWDRREHIAGRRILELGAGTSLPGIVAARCGARVTLSDSITLPKTLDNIRRCCALNGLDADSGDIDVIGLTWGLITKSVIELAGRLDYIIASDCFYDPAVFEEILVTVSYLLERNRNATFVAAYQVRVEDWSIQALLKKWHLCCRHVDVSHIDETYGIDLQTLMGDHTIYLLEISSVA